ncbi:hypothetical protein JXM67_14425 [candidate division WOR-3 bacterium]|nr:hypothetical protein [candidate division WOR-3 bacterium]
MEDEDRIRIEYALRRAEGKSIAVFERRKWEEAVLPTGEVTLLERSLDPVSRIEQKAVVVAVLASGCNNPHPGFDIYRRDRSTNKEYHYNVIENLVEYTGYDELLAKAGVEESSEIRIFIEGHIFIVGHFKRKIKGISTMTKCVR